MASPGTEHEEAAAPVETKTVPSETAPAPASPAAEVPPAQPSPPAEVPSAQPSPVEVPPAQPSPPVEVPSAQPSPVDAPLLAAPLQGPDAAETAPAPEAEGAPAPEPTSTALSDEANEAAPLPLVRAAASSSSSIDAATRSRRVLALFGPRPSTAWLAVAGVVAVVVFVAGVLTGRGLRSDPERRATSATAPSKAAAPASAAAPVAVAPTGDASPAALPRPPRMPATATKTATGFNAQAAKLAIDRIVPRLKTCKQAGEPPGSATVTVTFAPTGRVSSAQVTTTRYAGTRTGNCIVQRLREARIPEFSGAPMTVKRSVAVR